MIVGIDATNISRGGGKTHLIEFSKSAILQKNDRFIVWGPNSTLNDLPHHPRLIKKTCWLLNSNIVVRIIWHRLFFLKELKRNKCDILFAPGGSIITSFRPVVTMSRNMLPFDSKAKSLLGWSPKRVKFNLLKRLQIYSMSNADGLIFLTKYAENFIGKELKPNNKRKHIVIPHGVNNNFSSLRDYIPKEKNTILNLTYVSIIDFYKHQSELVEAVFLARNQLNVEIKLNLVGPYESGSMKKLNRAMSRFDPDRTWINYLGEIPHEKLSEIYSKSDFLVFASSCENLPNILLEMMAAGRPCIVSNIPQHREILYENAFYFDPYDPIDIVIALEQALNATSDRLQSIVEDSKKIVAKYSWEHTAKATLNFLNRTLYEG